MERNKMIQEKIRKEELVPVAWEKERVWQSIRHERKVILSVRTLYYAAASIVLIAGLGFYLNQEIEQRELNSKITALEFQLMNYTAVVAQDNESVNCQGQVEAPGEKIAIVNSLPHDRQEVKLTIPMNIPSEIIAENNPVIDSVTTLSYAELPKEIVEKPIEAIIGFIPEQPRQILSQHKLKKINLRFYRDDNISPHPLATEGKTLTARIN